MSEGFADFKAPGGKPLINSIFDFSAEALSQFRLWLEQNPPAVPISSILGFSQFTVQNATTVTTNQSTLSTTFTDLATVGPQLTKLPAGNYILIFGAACYGSAANVGAVLAPSIGGVAAAEADRAISTSTTAVSVMRIVPAKLTGDSNDVVMKYHVDTALQQANFLDRWLIALRYSNL